jgi:hypothetical protein
MNDQSSYMTDVDIVAYGDGFEDADFERVNDERRRKKLVRRAKKQAKLFAELGLDENGNPLYNFSLLKYPVREWAVTLPLCGLPLPCRQLDQRCLAVGTHPLGISFV